MVLTHAGFLIRLPYEFDALTKTTRDQMDQMVCDSKHPNWQPPFPFDGSCNCVNRIRDHAGTWQALDTLYNLPAERCHPLVNILNIQAIRNRFKLVKFLLEQELLTLGVQEPRILEVAAGSAQAVIEVMAKIRQQRPEVQALLLDFDPTALAHAKLLSDRWGMGDRIQTVVGNALRPANVIDRFKPNLIEMVGLADYLEDPLLQGLLRRFYGWLPKGGVVVVGNVITGNPEQAFIEQLYKWPRMVYRRTEDFEKLIRNAGFSECTIATEPHNIHALAVAHK